MSQLREWLQDDWMRGFLTMVAVWIVGVTAASFALMLFGGAIY